jgi:glycerol-3-phosphate dehydrogenase (NAD(P)+)
MDYQRITVIGDGAMATACAMLLDSTGRTVTLWGPFADHIVALERDRQNRRYLPGIPLPESLRFCADETEAMDGAQLIVSAAPAQFKRRVWKRFVGKVPAGVPIVSVAKGIENDTLLRPTQVIADVLDTEHPPAVLCGPSIAG